MRALSRRGFLGTSAALAVAAGAAERAPASRRFVRFEKGAARAYGLLDGNTVKELRGAPFDGVRETGKTFALGDVKLLVPCEPSKVLALAGNYKSHLGDTPEHKNPEAFIKAPSALLAHEGAIVIPKGAEDVHFEGELVIVIGAKAKDVTAAEAAKHIFGYTCGNDVSARIWQKNDVQWWRAKACDTFAPLGPWIACGIDPAALRLTTRVNGRVTQESPTNLLVHDAAAIVSFLSAHMTLLPGDIIYTGTPGTTSALASGDVVEVEIDGIGVLRNRVA